MREAFKVPVRDRYQIVHEHEPSRVRVEDTGLGIERTRNVILVQITTRPRSIGATQDFYRLLTEALSSRCGIAPNEVMVNFVTNADADWSFGNGEAPFLTGKLGS